MKYPIGIQSFEKIRKGDFAYVDKTDLVYRLTHEHQYVFLGRPRRFGKSLLLSTIQAYFEGRSELFTDLAIEGIEKEWTSHPVLHFDLNIGNYASLDGLITILNDQLSDYEAIYGKNPHSTDPQFRLRWLIEQAYEKTGSAVVILVDEYDKPILQSIGRADLDEAFREILKPFYGVLKSEDRYIRFAMLTGVSKFGKLSVFSDLNNIKDISLLPAYSTICGITKKEIDDYFSPVLAQFAESQHISLEEMSERLRVKYDGYLFSDRGTKVFNPYSLLNAFSDMQLKDYWFESGTPTFLVKLLKNSEYDLSDIDGAQIAEDALYIADNISALPILYQSGYLTIKSYDDYRSSYTLGYPNQEVESGFLNFLLPYYANIPSEKSKSEIFHLIDDIKAGNVDAFMQRLKSLFYSIPYSHDNSTKVQEDQFRNLIYLIFKIMGLKIQVEIPMSKGRTDAIVWTKKHIYIIEFKVDKTPEAAIAQIIERGYDRPYHADGRKVTLIGVNYSTSERSITGYITAEKR